MNNISKVIIFCFSIVFQIFSQEIILNEIMSSNTRIISDEDGEFCDWIEIYNYGDTEIRLKGYGLSDSKKDPLKWVFPDITISPGQYMIIWASGKNRKDPTGPLHTNFKIDASGEQITLALPFGTIIDYFPEKSLHTDISCGRKPNDKKNWYLFPEPTPEEKNETKAKTDILEPPVFSIAPGVYDSPIILHRPHYDDNVIIRYTLDGSEPSDSSPVFEDSLIITDKSDLDNDVADIPTNPLYSHDCVWKKPPKVAKGTVVRMAAFSSNFIPSETVTGTFFIFDKGTGRYSMPVVSIVTNKENFFSDETGIYVPGNTSLPDNRYSGNYYQEGKDWEREGNIEFFDQNGTRFISQGVSYRIHGFGSRVFPQKPLRIYAKSSLGNKTFDYPFFGNKPFNSFKRLLLRNSGNDFTSTMFRDGVSHLMVDHLDFDTQGFAPHIVFVNGEYWGIQNLRERYDKYYLQRVYGADPDSIDYLSLKGNFVPEISEGDDVHYNEMMHFVQNNNIAENDNYNKLKTYIDMDNLLDYLPINIYLQNCDWINNNFDFWRVRKPYDPYAPRGLDGRFRWLLYDVDFSYGLAPQYPDMIYLIKQLNYPLLSALLTNNIFRTQFINRNADLMNSAFVEHRALFMIDSIQDIFEPEIEEHVQRWGYPENKEKWLANIDEIKNSIRTRPSQMHQHLIEHYQLSGTSEVIIKNDILKGKVKINSLVLDEKLPGVNKEIYPWTGTYFNGNPIRLQVFSNDVYRLKKWFVNNVEYTDSIIEIDPGNGLVVETEYEALSIKNSDSKIVFKTQIINNYPNPFNKTTIVKFALSQKNRVILEIYGINGKKITRILDKELSPGIYTSIWDGSGLKSGIYLCVLRTGKKVFRQKLQLIR